MTAPKYLSPNFTLQEFLVNGPPARDLDPLVRANLERLVENVLQPARTLTDLSIVVTSGYRSEEVNKRVGGAPASDHLTGNAADVYSAASRAGSWRKNTRHLFVVMASSFIKHIGQIILEDHRAEGRAGSRFWIHVSNVTPKHSGEVLYSPAAGVYVPFDSRVHALDLA